MTTINGGGVSGRGAGRGAGYAGRTEELGKVRV